MYFRNVHVYQWAVINTEVIPIDFLTQYILKGFLKHSSAIEKKQKATDAYIIPSGKGLQVKFMEVYVVWATF